MRNVSTGSPSVAPVRRRRKVRQQNLGSQARQGRSPNPSGTDRRTVSSEAQQPAQASGPIPNFQAWGNERLSRNSTGEGVRKLQERLNQDGYKLEVDGDFGPQTERALRRWQKKRDLKSDGIVGPKTREAMQGTAKPVAPPVAKPVAQPEARPAPKPVAQPEARPAPKPVAQPEAKPAAKPVTGQRPELADKKMNPAEKYAHYAAMVEAAGGRLDDKKPTVLGLRGLSPDGKRHDSGRNIGSADETFVVLNRDKNGQPVVTELRGSTHAASKTGTAESRAKGGVAQLRPGTYEATRRENYAGREAWALNGGGNVPVYRDSNRDGHISDAERVRAERNNTQGNGILFHLDRGTSVGCQTLPPQLLTKFNQALGGKSFSYTLIDANQPLGQ